MAPANPANTTAIERTLGSTTPVAIVAATFVPKTRKAMKLNAAAHTTAKPGVSTRVATTVAMELAASWKPLTKSKPSATAMTTTRRRFSTVLGQLCLADDGGHDVAHLLEGVEGALERLDDVLPAQHRERLELAGEEAGQRPAVEVVAPALQLVDLRQLGSQVAHLGQLDHEPGRRFGRVVHDLGDLRHAVDGLLDVVQVDELARRSHVVHRPIDLLDEGQDVLTVERGDDARVQPVVHRPDELVAAVLRLDELLDERPRRPPAGRPARAAPSRSPRRCPQPP